MIENYIFSCHKQIIHRSVGEPAEGSLTRAPRLTNCELVFLRAFDRMNGISLPGIGWDGNVSLAVHTVFLVSAKRTTLYLFEWSPVYYQFLHS
jgi:hypothetical protein